MGGGGKASSQDATQGDLAGARIGAPFTLTNQDGAATSWDDFKGQYRLVYFGYTYCPDICPVDLQRIMQGFAQFLSWRLLLEARGEAHGGTHAHLQPEDASALVRLLLPTTTLALYSKNVGLARMAQAAAKYLGHLAPRATIPALQARAQAAGWHRPPTPSVRLGCSLLPPHGMCPGRSS